MRDTLPSLEIQPDYAILGEPTALSIYYGHDGSATFEVLIEGPDGFQVNDATHAVFENFRGQYCTHAPSRRARTSELCTSRVSSGPLVRRAVSSTSAAGCPTRRRSAA